MGRLRMQQRDAELRHTELGQAEHGHTAHSSAQQSDAEHYCNTQVWLWIVFDAELCGPSRFCIAAPPLRAFRRRALRPQARPRPGMALLACAGSVHRDFERVVQPNAGAHARAI
jgi:hypothetical protein